LSYFESKFDKVNLGCGGSKLPKWMNIDIQKQYCDLGQSVDLTKGIPFESNSFSHAFSSHFIEHVDYETTMFDFLNEVNRVLKPRGTLWVITPDLKKACDAYIKDKCEGLFKDRIRRNWRYKKKINNPHLYNKIIDTTTPTQHFINDLFHQGGQHKNLVDIELLEWVGKRAGFSSVTETTDEELRSFFPEIKSRGDSLQALYAVLEK
jgi:SAM-dependent methyltransferase